MTRPDWMEYDEWQVCQEQIRSFTGAVTLFAHDNQLFVVTWDFHLWWWDPVDGCFMPAEKLS